MPSQLIPVTHGRRNVCPEGDHCPVCVSNATPKRVEAALQQETSFQLMSRSLGDETPEQRHWRIADTRERYQASHEIWWKLKEHYPDIVPVDIDWSRVMADFAKGQLVADAYAAMVSNPGDPAVVAAYEALCAIIEEHYAILTQELGIHVDYVDTTEPYNTATEQAIDVIEHRHLAIASIEPWPDSYHPMLENVRGGMYDRFRAVHDAFGHVGIGSGFDRHGEYCSWLFHAMLCNDPVPCSALSTELHGANSFMWVTGNVAPFKAALLPPHLRDPQLDCETFGFKG